MARFSFPVPGRKKAQTESVEGQESMSNTHVLLGSTPLNIDTPASHNWDLVSNSGISVTVTDAPSPLYAGYGFDQESRNETSKDWEDESEILPQHCRADYLRPNDDDFSEGTSALRRQHSSSTINSWYDKSKQPLSISQQTSASAMARGLPSKARRLLDMDNSFTPPLTKKKPAKLDFSTLTPLSRGRSHQNPNGYVLGADMVTKSPSILSQLSPSLVAGRRLKKKPTKESLPQKPSFAISDLIRPSTGGSGRFPNHPNGVPDLYGHYEQMSLRLIMDLEPQYHDEVAEVRRDMSHDILPNPSIGKTSSSTCQGGHGRTLSRSTSGSKARYCSPSGSISSGHTRTSKGSKRTDNSFQGSDLQSKSILSLSSDSDDEGYVDDPTKSPASVFARRPSDFEEHAASLDNWRATNPESTSPSAPSLLQPPSPSRRSSLSIVSESSCVSWQSDQPEYGVQEARVVTMFPAQGPTGRNSIVRSGSESTGDSQAAQQRSDIPRASIISMSDQPTPPLSPSSVDFYIRSARSSIDGPSGGHSRLMAVSRQEELLLAALRQKRQLMRESFIAEEVSVKLGRHSSKLSEKGHKAKDSAATITQDSFHFDFPTPPTGKHETVFSSSPRSDRDLPDPSNTSSGTLEEEESIGSIVFPNLNRDSQQTVVKIELDTGETLRRRASHQSDECPISPKTLSSFPQPGQGRLVNSDSPLIGTNDSDLEDKDQILLPNRYSGGVGSRRSSHWDRSSVVPEEPESPTTYGEQQLDAADAGVPRPDSPISPDAFPTIPASRVTVNKKLARLSAVGSTPLSSQPAW